MVGYGWRPSTQVNNWELLFISPRDFLSFQRISILFYFSQTCDGNSQNHSSKKKVFSNFWFTWEPNSQGVHLYPILLPAPSVGCSFSLVKGDVHIFWPRELSQRGSSEPKPVSCGLQFIFTAERPNKTWNLIWLSKLKKNLKYFRKDFFKSIYTKAMEAGMFGAQPKKHDISGHPCSVMHVYMK